jgi:DNA polymerase sigma
VHGDAWPLQRQQQQPAPSLFPHEVAAPPNNSGATSAAEAEASPEARWFTALKLQVAEFAVAVAPTEQEQRVRDRATDALQREIPRELGHRDAAVLVFGSGASGLAVHCSDIDIVVAGGRAEGQELAQVQRVEGLEKQR